MKEFDERMKDFGGRRIARWVVLIAVGAILIAQHCIVVYFVFHSQQLGIDWKTLASLFSGMLLETYGVLREIVKFLFSEIPYNKQ